MTGISRKAFVLFRQHLLAVYLNYRTYEVKLPLLIMTYFNETLHSPVSCLYIHVYRTVSQLCGTQLDQVCCTNFIIKIWLLNKAVTRNLFWRYFSHPYVPFLPFFPSFPVLLPSLPPRKVASQMQIRDLGVLIVSPSWGNDICSHQTRCLHELEVYQKNSSAAALRPQTHLLCI